MLTDPDGHAAPTRLAPREHAVQIDAGVSSRAAEHLFWLGRYAERAESTARLLRAVLSRLTDPAAPELFKPLFLRACLSQGLLDADDTEAGESFDDLAATHALAVRIVDNLFDRRSRRSLAYNVDQTVRAAGSVRDRLSPDNWRLLRQLHDLVSAPSSAVRGLRRHARADRSGDRLARRRRRPRDGAHDARRRLEVSRRGAASRAAHLRGVHARLLEPEEAASHPLLEWLLELSDSLLTFRARYARQPDWPAVVELLVFDARNPRSVLFQLAKIAKHVPALPGATALDAMADIDALERMCRADNRLQGDLFGHVSVDEMLRGCLRAALGLSDGSDAQVFQPRLRTAARDGRPMRR